MRTGKLMGVLVTLALTATGNAKAEPWSKVPLKEWAEARTVDSCTEGMPPEGPITVAPPDSPAPDRMPMPVPQPPFGAWKEDGSVLDATGLTNCWSTMLLKDDRQDVSISVRLTVLQSSGAARQLPGGDVRWGFHWGENLPGWDVGVVLGYQDPLNFYRVQFSFARGELALWDSTGGFLQLIPCELKLDKPHDLAIRWRAGHVVVEVNGKQAMDYWDRTLPYTHGRVGLAVWKSAARVELFQIEQMKNTETEVMPAHKAKFRFEPTRNILSGHPGMQISPNDGVILFDGYEPISVFWKMPVDNRTADKNLRGALCQETVKLKPGWRASFRTRIGPLETAAPVNKVTDADGRVHTQAGAPASSSNGSAVLAGELPDAFKITGGGDDALTFSFQMENPGFTRTEYACTVRYDGKKEVYRYEYRGKFQAIQDMTVGAITFFDPLPYNIREPGPEVVYNWNAASHRWFVYQTPDNQWIRMPLADYRWVYEYPWSDFAPAIPWGKASDFLYPDPVACPAFETEVGYEQPRNVFLGTPGTKPCRVLSAGVSTWGFVFSHMETGEDLVLARGTERPFSSTFTALAPAEADAIAAKARLPDGLAQEKRKPVPFVASGTTFMVTNTWDNPGPGPFWKETLIQTAAEGKHGSALDETVGHGDKASMHIIAPGGAQVKLLQNAFDEYAKRWWVRGWFKTQGATGCTLKVDIGYPYGKLARGVYELGGGDMDWTYFSLITTVPRVKDRTDIGFFLDKGQAWIDDIAISGLPDDQNPPVTGCRLIDQDPKGKIGQ